MGPDGGSSAQARVVNATLFPGADVDWAGPGHSLVFFAVDADRHTASIAAMSGGVLAFGGRAGGV